MIFGVIMSEWIDIDTENTPRDGTEIILIRFFVDSLGRVQYEGPVFGCWCAVDDSLNSFLEFGGNGCWYNDQGCFSDNPTHWMAAPVIPKKFGAKEAECCDGLRGFRKFGP